MRISLFGISDKGCVRDNNEDMILLGLSLVRDSENSEEREIGEEDRYCALVSDGMGGHENGEEASEHTLMRIRSAIMNRNNDWSSPEDLFSQTVSSISQDLNSLSAERALEKAMGCTLTGLVFLDGKIYLVNVGDSRSYRYRDGILRQMSTDQTLHERDGVDFPQGKALYSCIGAACEPDTVIEEISGRIMEGDRFLICSDGLTDMVQENEIESILSSYANADEAAETLLRRAKEEGGRDNISVIVLDFPCEDENDTDQLLARVAGIVDKVVLSKENALCPHRNIALVREAFDALKTLPDHIEGRMTASMKISYIEQFIRELNEYDCPRMIVQMREYELSLIDQLEEESREVIDLEEIARSLQMFRDYIDESLSIEEFCGKYGENLRIDPVQRSERWEEIVCEAKERALMYE